MTALEKISAAEDKVVELQDALEVVGSVLETTEQIVIEGKKAGRCFRRLFKVLMVISIVAAIAMIVKKVLAGRSSAEEAAELEAVVEEAEVEAAIEEAEVEAAIEEIEEAEVEEDSDAS
jgi:hypothetical protein